MGRNWRKFYGVVNIKDRILAVFLITILVVPEKSRLLLETLTNQSRVATKFCDLSCQRIRDLWQKTLPPLVIYVNETVNFPTHGPQTPS
jgi:hypothetical protein